MLSVVIMGPDTSISRGDLQSRLGLGSGAIRSLIVRLTLNHLAAVSTDGMRLRGLGVDVKEAISRRIRGPVEVKLDYLKMDRANVAYVVKGVTASASEAVRLRDAVVRYAGTGATACQVEGDVISVPGVTDSLENLSHPDNETLRRLRPLDGDLVFISSAPSTAVAASAGAAAMFDLLQGR